MLIRKSLDNFKRGVLALCCFAVLSPSGVYASTSSYVQSDNSTELATYSYDAFGRRIAKTVNGSTTYYLYSGNQLIAELDESGEMVKAYGWDLNDELSSTPLWQAEVSNGRLDTAEYHTLINDHLGTPQMAVNDEGEVTWKALSESFGKSITDPQNQITMNLRFPGQYYDEETGTHYNYFRDYNPNTGRYIQKDPIGLLGGVNEYAYAYGNSLKYTDPTGEFAPLVIIAGWGAAEWAIAGLISAGVIGTGMAINDHLNNDQYGNPPFPVYVPTPTVPPPYTIPDAEYCPPGSYKIPDNAYDPNGPKAPGRPGEAEGFVPPKGGDRWVDNPNGRGKGWQDKGGRVWVPTGPNEGNRGDAHGGPHWDVQTPGGGYENVYPGGNTR